MSEAYPQNNSSPIFFILSPPSLEVMVCIQFQGSDFFGIRQLGPCLHRTWQPGMISHVEPCKLPKKRSETVTLSWMISIFCIISLYLCNMQI